MPTPDAILAALQQGGRLLTMATIIDPGAFHKLANAPFTIVVTLSDAPRADFAIDGEAAPVCSVEARDWPPAWGSALGEFCNGVLDRQSIGVRRTVKAALDAGANLVVEIDPDTWLCSAELRLGTTAIALGGLGLAAEGCC